MIEYDPEKNARNIAERGIALWEAEAMFEGRIIEQVDSRRDYGETRYVALGVIGGRVHVCVYTWRGDMRRIISLRRAKAKESNAYRQKTA